MQTFMPDSNYETVAKILDNKRLGKQRVEAFQILLALTGKSQGWIHHPATRMWRGHEQQLAIYGLAMCREWISRGFVDSLTETFKGFVNMLPTTLMPWWVTNKPFQISHQSNLLSKDWEHYSFYFRVPNDLPYLWPLDDEQAFRCGNLKERTGTELLSNGVVYLTSKQVAELLGVSPKTISAYKARSQMPQPDREYGRTPLWKHSTIQEWRGTLRTPVVPIK